jgi:RNA-binding protein
MIKSRQRAYLRSMANGIDTVLRVGKDGVTPDFTHSADEALEARELIKIAVLENAPVDASEAAQTVSERTRSQVVAVIGRKFILYRRAKHKPVIVLP